MVWNQLPRQRVVRQIFVLEDRGVFGTCSCGGDVKFYTDSGVKCSVCGKLYGLWYIRKKKKLITYAEATEN